MKQLFTRLLLLAGSSLASLAISSPRALAQTNLDPVWQEWVVKEGLNSFTSQVAALKVATDAAGNVYTLNQIRTGRNSTGIYLISKYDPSGKQLWRTTYSSANGPLGSPLGSTAVDLALDWAGNVYVTGTSQFTSSVSFISPSAFTTIKYSTDGYQRWVAQYRGTGDSNRAQALAVDQAGNVYVTGTSNGDYTTVKYNTEGQEQWANGFDSGGGDVAQDIAVDAAGNAVVTGLGGGDYVTVRYNPAGQRQWASRYDSGGSDVPLALVLDAAGNILITGNSADDYGTVKYSPGGQQQWVARYNGPGNGYDSGRALAVDATGAVYVTGTSMGASGRQDYATIKYSPAGQEQWIARYNPEPFQYYMANAIAVDAAGNAYVTGRCITAIGASEFVTIKYGAGGSRRWVVRYSDFPNSSTISSSAGAVDIALDAQNNVLVTGNAADSFGQSIAATIKYAQGPTPPPATGCNPLATEPTVPARQLATAVGAPITFTAASLLSGATDPLGRTLQVASLAKPSVGALATNADGSYTYTPPPGYTGPVALGYVVQETGPVIASPGNGHYYEFVSAPGICWPAAKTAAASRTYRGMQGYLATITYQGEQDFVSGRTSGQYWLGTADAEVEGEWRWQTGPEAGTLIWKGAANGNGLAYNHWLPGQPDDYQNQYRPQGEDYGLLYAQSGYWNDVDECATGAAVAGYLVEYGGLEACTPILYTLGTLTISVGSPAQTASTARLTASGPAAALSATGAEATVLEAMPNPSSGQFRVRLVAAHDGPAQLALFDIQGRRVRALYSGSLAAGETRELAVDGSGLAAGLYQLQLIGSEGTRTLRLSVQP